MHITIATGPIFPVPAVRGGAVQRLWEGLAGELAERGQDVTVFARAYPGQPPEERVNGVRFVRRGGYEQSTSIRRDLVLCLLYALRATPHVPAGDVIVTNDFWMPAVLPRLRPAAGKVVVNLNRFPKRQCGLYSRCAALAAVSGSVAGAVRRQSPAMAGKVVVVPNCLDAAFLHSVSGPLGDGSGSRPLRILFAGRLHPEKGLSLLARALVELDGMEVPPWECVLIGPASQGEGGGGEAYAREIGEATRGLPVRFEPPVYQPSALAQVYDSADILVYPSVADTGEAMPLAPLEAMARGAVPVVSDLPAFREYLEPDVNGLVFDHRSPDAARLLAAQLAVLLREKHRRRSMAAAAQETARRFSPGAIADRYLELFRRITAGPES